MFLKKKKVVGLDLKTINYSKSTLEISLMLHRHLNKLNAVSSCFADSIKIFIPENNLGFEANHMRGMIRNRPDLKTFWQKKNRPGILKGKDTADDYVAYISEMMRTNRIRFSKHLFTTTPGYTTETIKSELQGQIEQTHVEIQLPRTEFEKVKRTIGGKGGGHQDDLYISFAQCLFFGRVAKNAPAICFD